MKLAPALEKRKNMSRRLLFGTNWKMHKTIREAREYASRFRDLLGAIERIDTALIFVIPPFTAIDVVRQESRNKFRVGAQNMHWAEWGPYTGEISAPMLKDLGVEIVQLGHAERRQLFHESNSEINRKVQMALRHGLRPLICVGEDENERNFHIERETIAKQLRVALHELPANSASQIILAYEPFWAIGDNGVTAEPSYVREMTNFCRNVLSDLFGATATDEVPIIYGGSVNASAAPRFLMESHSDGVFVGRVALDPEAFAELIRVCLQSVGANSLRP